MHRAGNQWSTRITEWMPNTVEDKGEIGVAMKSRNFADWHKERPAMNTTAG